LKLIHEIKLNARYGFAGILNGLIGGGTIWALTKIGLAPVFVNLIGFAVGIIFAFLFSRKFVFRSKGHFTSEAVRYFVAFVISYLINIGVLQACITEFLLDPLPSQGIAVSSYVIAMYMASRFYIFRRKKI
jgi:putative flippase GtrA